MRVVQFRFAFVLIGVFFCSSIVAFAQAQVDLSSNIQCTFTKNYYQQPYQCAKACQSKTATLDAQRCFLQPQLKILDDGYFKTYYNASLFFAGNNKKALTCYDDTASKVAGKANGVTFDDTLGTTTERTLVLPAVLLPGISPAVMAYPGQQAHRATSRDLLVERTFGRWLHPWGYAEFNVSWSATKGGEWADLEAEPDSCGRYNLSISAQSLCRSPVAFVVMLGHEMVHREQYERTYKSLGYRDDLGRLRADLHEVEAYAWELRQGTFKWKFDTISKDPLYKGLTDEEVQESTISQQCYEWSAEKTIADWRTTSVKSEMEGYFKEDPWVKQDWLPKHADWATRKLGPIPEPETCCTLLKANVAECKAYKPYKKDPSPPASSSSSTNAKPCAKN